MSVFPGTSGSGFEGYPVQYVDPGGDNANPGTLGSPKKTLSAAWNDLADGGTIFGAPNCKWSDGAEGLGLIDGQGMWFSNGALSIPGFLTQKNVTFQGYGTTTYGPFGTQGARWLIGKGDGSTLRDNPGVWLVNTSVPITFQNVAIIADQPVRVGWDYRRNADENFTVKSLTVTSATRLNGSTTLTVTLPTSAITSFQRNAGFVKVIFTLDEPYAVIRRFCKVRINPGDLGAHFPAGDYQVDSSDATGNPGEYYFTYIEGSGSRAEEFPVGATFGTTGVVHGDTQQYGVVELHSNTFQFPSTMYLTGGASSNAAEIVVRDPYGGSGSPVRTTNVTVATPGTCTVQLRYLSATFETFNECPIYAGSVGGEKFGLGPAIDKGDIAGGAEWSWYRRNYVQGAVTGGPIAEQEIARTSSLFMTGVNSVGIGVYGWNMSEGGIYQPIANPNCVSTFDTVLQDTGIGTPIFPTLTMESGVSEVYIKNVSIADTSAHDFAADLGAVGGAVTVINTAAKGGMGTVFQPPPVAMGGNSTSGDYWSLRTESYDNYLWNGFWARDGRIAGKREDVQAAFGVIQHPGFSNLANVDVSAWTTEGDVTVTANQSTLGLDNTGKAFKIVCNSGDVGAVHFDVTTPTSAENDRVVVGFWVKASTDLVTGFRNLLSDCIFAPAGANIPVMTQYVPFGNDGAWDWVTDIQPLVDSQKNQTTMRFRIYVSQGHDITVYLPQVLYFSASAYTPNEVARQLRVFRAMPAYLASGNAGTMPDVKLIGHGGIGVSSALAKTVGVGSGQLTLTGSGTTYIPIYAADGTTIQGWIAQLQATVNP
jgi:hypothetical protein